MSSKKMIRLLCIAIILMEIGCSKDQTVSGTEIRNGNCVGKIFNLDGSKAQNAMVRLIPMDYNPYSQTTVPIDSTFTNANGDYAFNVSQPKFYNIVAEKGSTSCMLDSIFVQADAKTIVDNDTLRESGWLSGAIRLKPGDDSRKAIILVLGTNVYTVPSDTSGSFTSPLLPKGSYTIRIFTTLPGYTVFDTNVAIQEGVETKLTVTLPSSNAPSIAKLSATYDSATMFVSLAWPMPDTSKIVSYALYRKSKLGKDTMVILDKSSTSFVDDMIWYQNDSVFYQLAALGKNYKEGYRASTQTIIVCGKAYCIKKIDLTPIELGLAHIGYVSVFSDQENEIFLVGWKGIYKLDSNGIVQRDYILDNPETSLTGYLRTDDSGNLYMRKTDSTVIKFDRNLNVIWQRKLVTETIEVITDETVEVMGDGTLCAFDASWQSGTNIKVYDSAFFVTKELSVPDCVIYGAQRFGDTMVTYEYPNNQASNDYSFRIRFYDTAFTLLSAVTQIDFSKSAWGNPRFSTQGCYNAFLAAPNGVFVSTLNSVDEIEVDGRKEASLVLFTSGTGELLGRIAVPVFFGISFDSRGNLFFVTYKYTVWDDMGDDNPMKTLYIYTMRPLLKRRTN